MQHVTVLRYGTNPDSINGGIFRIINVGIPIGKSYWEKMHRVLWIDGEDLYEMQCCYVVWTQLSLLRIESKGSNKIAVVMKHMIT